MNATYQNIIKYRKLIFCQMKYSIEIALIPRLTYCTILRRALITQCVYLKVQVSKVHKKSDTANYKRLHNHR